MAAKESIIFGVRACLALAQHRPHDIVRVLHDKRPLKVIAPLLKAAAQHRCPYREVPTDDLNRVAKSVHHEGVVAITKPKATVPFGRWIQTCPKKPVLMALDRVTNPHNVGAILRTLSWFGGSAILTNDSSPTVNPAAMRVSQGGGELLSVVRTSDLPKALKQLKAAGIYLLGADQRSTSTISHDRSEGICFVMGNERDGLSTAVRNACDDAVSIPGVGAIESLNVSVAAGILLAFNHLGRVQTEL